MFLRNYFFLGKYSGIVNVFQITGCNSANNQQTNLVIGHWSLVIVTNDSKSHGNLRKRAKAGACCQTSDVFVALG